MCCVRWLPYGTTSRKRVRREERGAVLFPRRFLWTWGDGRRVAGTELGQLPHRRSRVLCDWFRLLEASATRVTTGASTEQARATRIATLLVTEHGEPKSYEDAVDLVALAYMRGELDARIEINGQLRAALKARAAS